MKRALFIIAVILSTACTPKMEVEVSNPSEIDRRHETVEIAWSELEERGFSPQEVVVWFNREEIPSQVLFNSQKEPHSLIFQCSTAAGASERYLIKEGIPAPYPVEAIGHYDSEHKSYTWENDKVAYRLHPSGMECCREGLALGQECSAPYLNERVWITEEQPSHETLNNGPIRTTVKLTYAPFQVEEQPVKLTKYISLDAHSRFNRIESLYEGRFETLPIASGFLRQEVNALTSTEEWIAFAQPLAEGEGNLYFGIIQPGAEFRADADGLAAAISEVESGIPMVYYAGSGQGDVKDMRHWMELLEEAAAAVSNPLEVTIL